MEPFLIGIYLGIKKPEFIDDFLLPLCEELEQIRLAGGVCIPFQGEDDADVLLVPVKVRAFIADTPARAFKSTRYPTHKFGCHGCNAKQVKKSYPTTSVVKRTDKTFRERTHKGAQVG